MSLGRIVVCAWLPDGMFEQLAGRFPGWTWLDGRTPEACDRHFPSATVTYGLPPVARLDEAPELRWVQLVSAGVPHDLCPAARARALTVTNLTGLYGPSIAEHTFAMLLFLARNFHAACHNQAQGIWDRDIARRLRDVRGGTLGIVGLGDIGRAVARTGQAFGLRVVGTRRRAHLPAAGVDRVYPPGELKAMLAEADHVVVALPSTPHTDGLLGVAEFAAMKKGAIFINVSRGSVVREEALVEALRSGHVAAAGLDVFAVEPLPPGHPLWAMPQVLVVPHIAGEAINQSDRPAERFARNLAAWQAKAEMEGVVDLEWGY
jgi:phosphoglycerate dehydrogenase-like enzyme